MFLIMQQKDHSGITHTPNRADNVLKQESVRGSYTGIGRELGPQMPIFSYWNT